MVFLFILVRISAIVALLPIFGSDMVPLILKAGFSFVCAIVLLPFVHSPEPVSGLSSAMIALLIIKEILVGVLIGFTTTVLFSIIQFAGKMIDTQIGFSVAEIIDPITNVPTSVTAQLLTMLFTIYFLLINGHFFFILAFQKSFEVVPLITVSFSPDTVLPFLIELTNSIFTVSLRLAAPLLCVLFLVELSLGIIARTIPQINIFFVGFPAKLIIGLLVLLILMGPFIYIFKEVSDLMIKQIWTVLYLMAHRTIESCCDTALSVASFMSQTGLARKG
ncbi:MAG: flagellar biosynthetic protein FliR [Chitinivibrionales bacterium]|nr:flagellar biosynthetic protein FliR [Chitinivibrionales bacterium]